MGEEKWLLDKVEELEAELVAAEVVRAALKKIEAIVLMNPYTKITSERILDTIREVFGEQ